MARAPRRSDLLTMLRGLGHVGSAALELRSQEITRAWATSSLRPILLEGGAKVQETVTTSLQQPQVLQHEVSKAASEAVARISMVTEGIKAYRASATSSSATETSQEPSAEYDPVYDPSIQELSIEEMMMQEAVSGHSDHPDYRDGQYTDTLTGVQIVVDAIADGTRETREEISRRLSEFEPLLDITKTEEREINDEHLDAIDKKLDELESVAYGHQMNTVKGVKQNQTTEESERLEVVENKDVTAPNQVLPEMNIESMMMEEAVSGHKDRVANENIAPLPDRTIADIFSGVQQAADKVGGSVSETKDSITRRIEGFEPLLDISKVEEKEITEEHLQALNDKLSELQDVAFGHNLTIFREVEHSKPMEEVLRDVAEQSIAKEESVKVANSSLAVDRQNIATATNADKELDFSLSQVAKPVSAEELETSAVHVEVQIPAKSETQPNQASQAAAPPNLLHAEVKARTEVPSSASIISAAANSESTIATDSPSGDSFVTSEVPGSDQISHSHTSTCIDIADQGISTTATVAAVAAATVVGTNSLTSTDDPLSKSVQTNASSTRPKPKLLGRKPLAKEKPKSRLAESAQARKVPHSRIGRLMSFGGLAAGLGVGTVAEVTRRTLGLNQGKNAGSLLDGSPFLTEANAKRIVDTLCRVRGAALKLGQMLSIQDSALINPQLQKIFERVRQSADFMPGWQLERAIVNQLGEDWRSKVATFDERPFAAASIGQVHLATLQDSRSVAMKIQYPGVAEGIDSDINNLISSLKVANILPEGLFVDSIIEVAKRELGWECDYMREAKCTQRYRDLVQPYPEYYVPEVIPQLCSQQIFTTELIDGIPVDKCVDMDQESRNYLCEKILRLCLMELFQFGFMQTDPNWSNFFYNAETEQVALLDFGACRDYSKEFVDKYIHLIHGAAVKDREKVLKYSQELGFLTGYEAKVMEDAHIDAIMILGEAFQEDRPFYFGDQNTTHRIQHLVPVMLSHRMCAPPEESYSLHRKMSGVFLLCTKLNGVVNCYRLFHEIYGNYRFGGTWKDLQAGLQQ